MQWLLAAGLTTLDKIRVISTVAQEDRVQAVSLPSSSSNRLSNVLLSTYQTNSTISLNMITDQPSITNLD